MAALSNLLVSIRASASEWSSDVKAIQRDATALDKTLRPIQKNLADFGKPLLGVGTAITGTFVALGKVAANYGDAIDQASEKTGIGTQQLGRWKFAADQSNTSFDDLSTGLKFLAKNMFAAATGSKEQADVFKALGVSLKTTTGELRPTGDVLLEISQRFSELPDGAEKAALSMRLFGKQGETLIPFLNRGKDGLKDLGDQAEKLGLALDPAQAKLGDQFNKALDRAKNAGLGFALSISGVILPTLKDLTDSATNAIIGVRNFAEEFPGVTKAIALTGVALTGAGGLLVGLSGFLILAPKVASGLLLIQSALSPVSILSGVRSIADLNAGITLLGETSIFAKAGMVGLAAGIGIAIGSIANMTISALGLRESLDSVIRSMLNWNDSIIGKWLTGQRSAEESASLLTTRTQALSDALAKQGIVIARGSDSLQSWNDRVMLAAKSTDSFEHRLALQAVSTMKTSQETETLDQKIKRLIDSMSKVDKDPFAELAKSFESALRPAAELESNISILALRFGKSSIEIIRAYSSEIVQVAEKQKLLGEPIPPLVAAFYEEAKSFEHLKASATTLRESLEKLHDAPLPEKLIDFSKGQLGLSSLDILTDSVAASERASEEIQKIHQKTFENQAELRKTDLDENLEVLEKIVKAEEHQQEERKRQYDQSIADIKRSSGAIFDDLFQKGQSVFGSLRNLLKGGALSLGRAIFEDINSALFGPLLDSLRSFFNTTVKGIIQGALGGIGKSIGGLIGIGGSAGAAGAGATGASGAGGAAGGIGILGLSGAATLGIGAAVAGVALLANHFIGQGRDQANKFTTASQNQFGVDLGNTFNEFQNSRNAGTLTLDQATQLQSQMTTLLQGITSDANEFGAQGKNQKKVIDQFFADQQRMFGKDWVNLTSQIDTSIATLKSQAAAVASPTGALAGPLAGIPETGRAISASSIFADAVAVFKTVVDSIGGASASSGPPITITVTSAPEINISVESSDMKFRVRDEIVPELLSELSLNMNTATTKLIQILKSQWPGVVTTGGAIA